MSKDDPIDDAWVSDVYQSSKTALGTEPTVPPSHVDDSILAMAATKVPPSAEPTKTSGSVSRLPRRWRVPSSLVACLIVTVTVGLIYRENADHIGVSDAVAPDYGAPYLEKEWEDAAEQVSAPASISASVPEMETLQEETIEASPLGLPVMGNSMLKQEAKAKRKPALKRQSAPAPSAPVAEKVRARSMMMDADVAPAARSLSLNRALEGIRHQVARGDVEGARAALVVLLEDHPAFTVPEDLVFLKEVD